MALVFAAMGPSTTSQQVAEKEASENKRLVIRIQIAFVTCIHKQKVHVGLGFRNACTD